MRLRVLTLNVQNDAGDPRRTALINAVLRRQQPDLVALQEVCYPADGFDHLAELLDGTGLTHTTHQTDVLPHLPALFRHDGTAIATRWPHQVAEYRESPGDPHWWTLAVRVDVPDLGELLLITPTTPWRLDQEAAREQQALDIADLDARHRTAVPTVLAGDFNAAPESASIRFLSGLQSLNGRSVHFTDAWSAAGSGPGYTWTTDNPLAADEVRRLLGQTTHHRRIDYIFTNATITSAALLGDRPIDGLWLSDHFCLTADLECGDQESSMTITRNDS